MTSDETKPDDGGLATRISTKTLALEIVILGQAAYFAVTDWPSPIAKFDAAGLAVILASQLLVAALKAWLQ